MDYIPLNEIVINLNKSKIQIININKGNVCIEEVGEAIALTITIDRVQEQKE